MNKIIELTEEIQGLENSYAESLARNENHIVLYSIWKKIKELRAQLEFYQGQESEANDNS